METVAATKTREFFMIFYNKFRSPSGTQFKPEVAWKRGSGVAAERPWGQRSASDRRKIGKNSAEISGRSVRSASAVLSPGLSADSWEYFRPQPFQPLSSFLRSQCSKQLDCNLHSSLPQVRCYDICRPLFVKRQKNAINLF